MKPLNVLMVNRSMHATSGTELYVRDVARELVKKGHRPVVFTPAPGVISDQLGAAGIRVESEMSGLDEVPDIIHGQHAWTTLALLLRFPTVPAIFVGHDAAAWTDMPPRVSSIRKYVAVDHALWRRFVTDSLLPKSRVTIIPNAIDFSGFRKRGPLPDRPVRALLISNYSGDREREEIHAACAERGISLDAVGRRFGNLTSNPGDLYARYDLVFAKGRCALEASATGAAVVYCDTLGCGPMLSNRVLDAGSGILAGRHLMAEPLDRYSVAEKIDAYDPLDAESVSARIRKAYDPGEVVSKLVTVYRSAIAEQHRQGNEHSVSDTYASVAQELIWWNSNAEEIFGRQFQAAAEPGLGKCQPDRNTSRVPHGAVDAGGWYAAEADEHGSFWWLGPEPSAWVDVEVPHQAAPHLHCSIAHAMESGIIQGIEVRINGCPAQICFSDDDGPVIRISLPGQLQAPEASRLRVLFQLPQTARPRDVNPLSRDERLLGIAIRRIEFATIRSAAA